MGFYYEMKKAKKGGIIGLILRFETRYKGGYKEHETYLPLKTSDRYS